MHGEHKTPGGKLVMVDLERVDGRLRDVTVAGDFFLYPDDALGAITASLEGLDASLTEREVTEQVACAIAPGTELLGTSAEGIAIAVRRALETANQADTP